MTTRPQGAEGWEPLGKPSPAARPLGEAPLLLLVAAAVLALDQATKHLVLQRLPLGASWAPIPALERWFTITHTRNAGASFGLFPQLAPVFLALSIAVVVGIVVYTRFLQPGDWRTALALGLMLGGAAGNLVDRLRIGHVVDFLDFKVWPVFNCADSALVVGVALLLWFLLREPQKRPQGKRPEDAGSPSSLADDD
ncbi:MAG: signal peptidase II [Anaerolineae bacterium]